jgi:(+)-neomenthol dehydrogenase
MDRDQRLEWLWRNSRETYDAAKKGLQTNYYGTKNVIEALLPLLQASSDGRIVNVSSDFGLLRVSSFDHPLFQVPIQCQRIILY